MKANVSEADHPLLCEGTRRQRGDMALLLHAPCQLERYTQMLREIIFKAVGQRYSSTFQKPKRPYEMSGLIRMSLPNISNIIKILEIR